MKSWFFVSVFIVFGVFSCKKDAEVGLPLSFTQAFIEPDIIYPADNFPTAERIELGKYLFYNPLLAKDSSVSCASCHAPQFAFANNVALSSGFAQRKTTSNSPSLTNIVHHPYYTRAGGVPSLEMQILVPIQEHTEFNFNLIDLVKRLENDTYFIAMAGKSYPNLPLYRAITAGLASFERTLISKESKFDLFLQNKSALTSNESKGMALFFSDKANCFTCHNGFNFTDYHFKDNLISQNLDSGRFKLIRNGNEIGKIKTPSLRNVEKTAPYMHDGSINSLEEVIKLYNKGGQRSDKNAAIKPLNLSDTEQKQLVLFLKTLTDEQFMNNPLFKP